MSKKFSEQEQGAIKKYIEEKGINKVPKYTKGLKRKQSTLDEEEFQAFMMEIDEPLKRVSLGGGTYRLRKVDDIEAFYEKA